ncbi:MAG: serine hydrolase [Gemmatimonadales bacterium]
MTPIRPIAVVFAASVVAACGGATEPTSPPPPPPPPAVAVATVSVAPDSIDVQWKATASLAATPLSATGAQLSGRSVTWQSSDQSVATVNGSGVVSAVNPGTATITATSEGKAGSARVRVVAADLSRIVDSIRQAFGLPGMGGAIVTREAGVVAVGVGGIRRVGSSAAVTVDDTWHLGSNTKALTALLATMAVEAGVVSWNQTVEQAFPELGAQIRAEHRSITLLDLVNNQSGVVNNTAGLPFLDAQPGRDVWNPWTLAQPAAAPRGTYYYSNNGFALAGTMVERAWGASYEDLMDSRIFQPLGVTGAGWGPTAPSGSDAQPSGHIRSGAAWVACTGFCDNLPGLSAAGTIHLPIRSWGRIIQEVLKAYQGQSPLLSQSAAQTLAAGGPDAGGGARYSHGWVVLGSGTGLYLTHDGSNTMNHSRASLFPAGGVAFLQTTNAADGTTAQALVALELRLQQFRDSGR